MAESVIGRGTIEIVGDARKLRASIEEAKKSLRTLGEGQRDISKGASQSIDKFIGRLQAQNATFGKSARETELFKLSLRGASNEQLKLADSALRLAETQQRNAAALQSLKVGFIAFAAAAAAAVVGAGVAIDSLIKRAGDFQDLGEKIGDSGENIASLSVAAAVGGTSMENLAAASVRLTKGLTGVDDESKAAGAAVEALGLNLAEFKNIAPAAQIEAVARALAGFQDGAEKTAVAVALFGKSGADLLPFLKELETGVGRQNILSAEQIRLADEYSDTQKRVQATLSLQAQAIATDLLPSISALTSALADLAKEQEVAATASAILQGAFNASLVVFQALIVLASDVAFVFLGVGREIGAVAAQLAALARLDIQGFRAISDAVKEDGERARAELDKFQARILSLGTVSATPAFRDNFDSATQGAAAKPRIKFSGAVTGAKGSADSSARAEAAAQLQSDLDQIKKASDATTGAFSNAERIMQAMRSASLVNDRDYYASKLGFIQLNSQAQEKALQDQIARLQQETFAGKTAAKDRIDNERKIADAQAQIAKIRADASANTQINSIEEAAANRKLAQSYLDASKAAEAYIDSIERRNAREQAGIGRGNRFREELAGLGDIDDRFRAQRQRLEGELRRGEITRDVFDTYLAIAANTYEKEVDLFRGRTDSIARAESDWITGATEALSNYADEARDVARQTEEVFTNAFNGLEDALVEFVQTGKLNFKSLAQSISADLTRAFVKQNITGPLADLLKGGVGSIPGIGGSVAKALSPADTADADAGKAAASLAEFITSTEAAAGAAADLGLKTIESVASTVTTQAALGTLATSALSAAAALQTMAASSAASGGGDLLGAGLGLLDDLPSFDTGIKRVPMDMIARLHEGERVITKAENSGSSGATNVFNLGGITFNGPQDKKSVSQGVVEAGRRLQREMARNT